MILTIAMLAAAMSTAPGQYQIHATMIQDGKVLYDPRLVANAGEPATFVTGDGKTDYDLRVVATPDSLDKAGPDGVALSVDLSVGRQDNRRHLVTKVVVKPGELVTLTLPASAANPSISVNISADKA